MEQRHRSNVKGVLTFGANGVAIGPNSQKNIDALNRKLIWLVVGEIYPDETSGFWEMLRHNRCGNEKKQIQTEVYRLPCAGFSLKKMARSLTQPAGCSGNGLP